MSRDEQPVLPSPRLNPQGGIHKEAWVGIGDGAALNASPRSARALCSYEQQIAPSRDARAGVSAALEVENEALRQRLQEARYDSSNA